MSFEEIAIEDLQMNPFTKIGQEWFLITAGTEQDFNMMTASWGGMGILWKKNVFTSYLRPQRYTKEFVDANEVFTISFFGPEYKQALAYCGRVSGRDEDKVLGSKLTPFAVGGTTAFEEASLIFVCQKMYCAYLDPAAFKFEETIDSCYPKRDFHMQYIAEITKVLINTEKS